LKVLYVIDQKPDGYPGGIEYHQLDLINSFLRRKIPVYLFFPGRDSLCLRHYDIENVKESKYKGIMLNDHRLKDRDTESVFHKILEDTDVDIVHFHSVRTLPLSLIEVAKKTGKKVVITLHEYYFWCINCIMLAPDFCWFEKDEEKCSECLSRNNYQIYKGYVKERRKYINYLLQMADRVIVPSFYVKNVFLNLYRGLAEERWSVIEFGVDSNLLKDFARNENNATNSIRNHKFSLGFLGNFLHYKGNKTFLNLINHFKNSENVNFSIIGNVFDHTLIPSYRNLYVAGGYTRGNVLNKIHQSNPDMILLLSNWPETFSYTLSEAIASGVPVIATDAGALRERVSKEAVGFLVPVENPLPRLIELIEDIRQHPEVLNFLRGQVLGARKRLKTIEEMADEIFKVYDSI